MKLNPFQKGAGAEDADIDITPFMSLMVVLIPVLLVSVKFSVLAQYDVHSNVVSPPAVSADAPIPVAYRLVITEQSLALTQGEQTLFSGELTQLADWLPAFQQRLLTLTDKAPLLVSLQAPHSYQKIVSLLDILHQPGLAFSSVSVDVHEDEEIAS